MKNFWLILKTRVSGYLTQQGTWVDTYYDKRPTRKEKPKPDESGPSPSTGQLNLFSLLNEPSKVVPQTAAPHHDTSTVTEEPAPPKLMKKPRPKTAVDRVILDYERPWSELEAIVPEFGAKDGWTPSQRKKANNEASDIWRMLQVTKGAKNEPLTVKDQLARANRLVLNGDLPKTWRTKLTAYSGEGGIGDSLNEYYTPPKVAAAMWYLLRRFGLERGHVLEPSAGNGVFQETKPAGITMTAVEWSPMSAGMNALLHPEDDVQAMALEHFVSADATRYDAVVGNVPFGVRGAIAGFDKPDLGKAEEYFVDTCLDKTKEGGLVCLVVPHGIATNPTSRSFRKRVLSKAEVVGLHRLPNTAFRHSGTAVVTDILLLRKREQDVANALSVLDEAGLKGVGVWDQSWVDGDILDDAVRGHLHGTAQANWRGGYDIEGDMGPVPEAVATMPLPDLPDDALTLDGLAKALESNQDVLAKALRAAKKNPYPELATGTTKLINGELYILQGEPRRWHRAADVGELTYEPSSKEGQALALGQRLKQATDAVRDGLPISNLEQLRTDVKAYIATHGNPGGDKTLAALGQRDPRFLPLIASVTADGTLSDLLEGKTAGTRRDESIDWANFDEMAKAVLNEDGRTMSPAQFLESWAGEHTEDEVLRHLYASDRYAVRLDGAAWGLREDLTAGDLYPKLDAHEVVLRDQISGTPLHEQFRRQRQWLIEAIQPKTLEEFEVSLRSGFVPVACLSDYFTWVAQRQGGDGRIRVTFDKGVFSFLKEEGSSKHWIWFDEWHDRYLNRDGMRKEDWERMPEKEQAFKDWLSTSQAWRGVIEEGYNRSFNSFKPKRYGDQPVEVPGWNPDMALNDYQHPALRWGLEEGKGIIAYDVGLGKTAYALALIAKLKEQGQVRRPVIVVPKSVTANWAAEVEKFRPGSKVLIIGETHSRTPDGTLVAKPDSKAERDKKWHLMTQNDYDYILVTQPAFNDIDVDPIVKGEYVRQDFWVQRAKQLDKATDRRRREIEERYHQAMADKDFIKRSNAIYWNQLGVDLLIADEAHGYKNLFTARDRFGETPKFLGGSGFAKRALDMSHKAQWIRDKQQGHGVYFLTATPTKNSPLEVYSMLSHIAPEAFTSRGIRNEEDFIDRYCEIETRQVLGTDGVIADSPVVTGFKNMDELRSVMGRYIYRKTADEVGLKLPDKQVHEHFVDMTDDQETEYMALRALAKNSKNETGDAHIFSIMDKMAKAAMDLSLLDASRYQDAESPKLDAAVKNIVANAKDGGQIVFADQVPVHQRLKDRLFKAGIKESEIGIINAQDAPDSAKRQNLANDFVNGKLKVIIGNTATMGEGVNLQKHTSDIHHLDIPWEPASIQQRNGRGLRQGNILSQVRIHTYLSKHSFDGYRWQTMSGKKDWMDQLWHGADRVDNPAAQQGVASRDELLLMMADDPLKARAELEKNKDEQMKRYVAIQKKQASDTFRQYVKAKMTYAALKDPQEPTAQMLKMRIDRIRGDLQRHEQFPDKGLLDVEGPILLTAAGQTFRTGAAFLMEGGGKGPATISSEPTTWSVEGVDVGKRQVTMRPIGHAATSSHDTGITTFDLQDLESGLTPTDPVSAGAELRHIIAQMQHPVALKRYPREMLEEHLPAIQDRLRALMSQPRDYATYDEGDYKRKELWGIEEGRTTPTKIFPGSKEAATATYIVPNTELMNSLLDHAIQEQDQAERRRDTYGYGRRRGRSSYNAYEHRFREALYQFFEYQERDRMMRERKRAKQEQQEGLAKGGPRVTLFWKSFPDHKGRPGHRGGSSKRDIEHVRKEEQGRGKQASPKKSEQEVNIERMVTQWVQKSFASQKSNEQLERELRWILGNAGWAKEKIEPTIDGFRQMLRAVRGDLSKSVLARPESHTSLRQLRFRLGVGPRLESVS